MKGTCHGSVLMSVGEGGCGRQGVREGSDRQSLTELRRVVGPVVLKMSHIPVGRWFVMHCSIAVRPPPRDPLEGGVGGPSPQYVGLWTGRWKERRGEGVR